MFSIMSAVYLDLFAAMSCYSSVPTGCLTGSPGSSTTAADLACANGLHTHTPAE